MNKKAQTKQPKIQKSNCAELVKKTAQAIADNIAIIKDGESSEQNEDFFEQLFMEHNRVRKRHFVKPLKFSNLLHNSAQDWAETLLMKDRIECSPFAVSEKVGELIFIKEDLKYKKDITALEAMRVWYSVIQNYNFETCEGNSGTFTQLVWADTKMVGFGKAHHEGKYVVVAHYLPPGNVRGDYNNNVFRQADKQNKKNEKKHNGDNNDDRKSRHYKV